MASITILLRFAHVFFTILSSVAVGQEIVKFGPGKGCGGAANQIRTVREHGRSITVIQSCSLLIQRTAIGQAEEGTRCDGHLKQVKKVTESCGSLMK